MKICRKCGRSAENNTFYCPDCGSDLGKPLTKEEIALWEKNQDKKEVIEYDELGRRMTGATIGRYADVFRRGEK